MSASTPIDRIDLAQVRADADRLLEEGRGREAIDLLSRIDRMAPDPAIERRLAEVRNQTFDQLTPRSAFDRWPVPVDAPETPHPVQVPLLDAADLSGASIRAAIGRHGSVRVPRLLDAEQVGAFTSGIDHVLALREANQHRPFATHSSWFAGLPLPPEEAESLGRPWIAGAGGFLACDSPRLLELLFTTYEQVGLRPVVADYLGESPVLSANKCTFRRVPTTAHADWHQDGAFLGSGIRALNVWIALSPCGVDAPGLDLVPRRFETIQETGSGGAIFDWAVGPEVVRDLSADAPVVRPHFEAGDALLFDDLFLHRTAVATTMSRPRHAIESWFFAPTDYPDGQVPLVW